MRPLRVLWLTRDYPYPADSGWALYSQGLITSFAATGAEITALAYGRGDVLARGKPVDFVADGVRWMVIPRPRVHDALSLIGSLPSDIFSSSSRALWRMIESLLNSETWHAVVFDHIATAWALFPLLRWQRATGRRVPLVYVSHNHEATLRPAAARRMRINPVMKAALRIDGQKYATLERRVVKAVDLVTAITEEDRVRYLGDAPEKPVITLSPGHSGKPNLDRVIDTTTPRRVVTAGSFEWIVKQQNLVDFIRVADPLFTKAGVTLHVVGRAAPEFIGGIKSWARSCTFTGPVAAIEPHLEDARMAAMAEQVGGGFKLKMLDYVFGGLPIAAIGHQIAGLPLVHGEDVLAADTVEALCARIVETIDQIDLLNRIRRNALSKCLTGFDWSTRGRDLFAAIEARLVEPGPADAQGGRVPDPARVHLYAGHSVDSTMSNRVPSHPMQIDPDIAKARLSLRRDQAVTSLAKAFSPRRGGTQGATASRRRKVLALGFFPPPIDGQRMVTQHMFDRLADTTTAMRFDLDRFPRLGVLSKPLSALAAAALVPFARLSGYSAVYVAPHSGVGLLYSCLLVGVSNLCGCTLHVHYHSYRNVRQYSPLMAAFLALCGRRAVHIVLAPPMEAGLRRFYASVAKVEVLSNSAFIPPVERAAPLPAARIRVGHLSNLSREKGIGTVIDCLRRLRARGIEAEFVIGGPPADAATEQLLTAAIAEFGECIRYLGPLAKSAVRQFYASIDLFLFPSTYEHEAEPLVVIDAVAAGVPVLATDRGCIGYFLQATGCRVFDPEDFVERAVEQIAQWASEPERLAAVSAQSRARFAELHDQSRIQLDRVLQTIVEPVMASAVSSRAGWAPPASPRPE